MYKLLDYPLYSMPAREIRFENDSDELIEIRISTDNSELFRSINPRETISFMTEHPLYYLFVVFKENTPVSKSYPIRSNSNYITLKETSVGYQPMYMIQTAPPSY